jgi:hypothetical protein
VVPLLVVLWPLTVALVRRRERFRDRRPPVYFKLHKLERYPEAFGRELREQGDTALARRLFGEQ